MISLLYLFIALLLSERYLLKSDLVRAYLPRRFISTTSGVEPESDCAPPLTTARDTTLSSSTTASPSSVATVMLVLTDRAVPSLSSTSAGVTGRISASGYGLNVETVGGTAGPALVITAPSGDILSRKRSSLILRIIFSPSSVILALSGTCAFTVSAKASSAQDSLSPSSDACSVLSETGSAVTSSVTLSADSADKAASSVTGAVTFSTASLRLEFPSSSRTKDFVTRLSRAVARSLLATASALSLSNISLIARALASLAIASARSLASSSAALRCVSLRFWSLRSFLL